MPVSKVTVAQQKRFDWVVDGLGRGPNDLFDVPVIEDRVAVGLPSVGSLVPGWTLVVPRARAASYSGLDTLTRAATTPLRNAVADRLRSAFSGQVFEFEHGPAGYGRAIGCGVDQAHVHLVPLEFDLVSACDVLQGERLHLDSSIDDPWSLVPGDVDYWLVRNTLDGTGWIVLAREQRSQAIRRVIADKIGGVEWDYRVAPSPRLAEVTRTAFC